MTQDIYRLLESSPFLIGDGAMGTMLQVAGLSGGAAPELWNVEHPDVIRNIYQEYVDAGSQIISTNTFGGTSYRLKLHNLQDKVAELNRAGASLAREVAGDDVLVAGSIGPTGELFEPMGTLTAEDAQAAFAEQTIALSEGGVDLFIIETMSDLNEVEAAVRACRQAGDHPIAATLTFDTNFHTMMGVKPAVAVQRLSDWGVSIVGANCGNGPDEIKRVVGEMVPARSSGVYLMAQSNAGLPHYEGGEVVYDGTPEIMADYALDMASMGVNIIGGCCGTTPTHIRAMKEALSSRPIPEYQPEIAIAPPAEGTPSPRQRPRIRRARPRS